MSDERATLWTGCVKDSSEATRGLAQVSNAELADLAAQAVEATRDEVERRTRPYRGNSRTWWRTR
jgi:hypothetical protein